jgi:hypothetical protein
MKDVSLLFLASSPQSRSGGPRNIPTTSTARSPETSNGRGDIYRPSRTELHRRFYVKQGLGSRQVRIKFRGSCGGKNHSMANHTSSSHKVDFEKSRTQRRPASQNRSTVYSCLKSTANNIGIFVFHTINYPVAEKIRIVPLISGFTES